MPRWLNCCLIVCLLNVLPKTELTVREFAIQIFAMRLYLTIIKGRRSATWPHSEKKGPASQNSTNKWQLSLIWIFTKIVIHHLKQLPEYISPESVYTKILLWGKSHMTCETCDSFDLKNSILKKGKVGDHTKRTIVL